MHVGISMILKNGEKFGYPWRYALASVLPVASGIWVGVDPGEDDTLDQVTAWGKSVSVPVHVIPQRWTMWRDPVLPARMLAGATNDINQYVQAPWTLYIQADEIWSDQGIASIQALPPVNPYWGYLSPFIHLRPDFDHEQRNPGYTAAIRLIRTGYAHSGHDAWSFSPMRLQAPEAPPLLAGSIFHVGYIEQPAVVKARMHHHATELYPNLAEYQASDAKAQTWDGSIETYWDAVIPFDYREPYPLALVEWRDLLEKQVAR